MAYAFSPIDLIPDFIPELGTLDDFIVVPLGVLVVRRMIPDALMSECRMRAERTLQHGEPLSRMGAAIIVGLWLLLAIGAIVLAAPVAGKTETLTLVLGLHPFEVP